MEVLQAGEVGYAGYEEDNHPYEVDNSDDDEPGDGGDIVEGSQVGRHTHLTPGQQQKNLQP